MDLEWYPVVPINIIVEGSPLVSVLSAIYNLLLHPFLLEGSATLLVPGEILHPYCTDTIARSRSAQLPPESFALAASSRF